jgi:hypothetical protein
MSKGTIAALVLLGFFVIAGGFGLLFAALIRMFVWFGILGLILAGFFVSLRLIRGAIPLRTAERQAAEPTAEAPAHPSSLSPDNRGP